MTLLNAIILPFQAGYENIITASGKPRELSVIKRTFADNVYQYNLQADNSLFSWQGRVSMFAKGVALCLPFIGHITSVALRYFSSSIFPEIPLDFAIKCSPEQKLEVAKWLYISKPERVNEAIRLTLAKILATDSEGLDLLVTNISYLDLTIDIAFSLKIIQQNPKVLDQINDSQFAKKILSLLEEFPSEQKLAIAKQFYIDKPEGIDETARLTLAKILAEDTEGLDLLVTNISYLDLTTDVAFSLKIIQQNPKVLCQINDSQFVKKILSLLEEFPSEQKLAIAKQFYIDKPEGIDETARLTLAKILAEDTEGLDLLVTNISYLDLTTDVAFSLKIIQQNPKVLDQINDSQFAKKILSLLEEFPSEQKLVIVTFIYANELKVDDKIRVELVRILANDLATIPDEEKSTFTEILEQTKGPLVKQILQQDPTDYKFITAWLGSLHLNEDLTKSFIKELILQTKEIELSHQMQAAIIYVLNDRTNNDFIEQILKDKNSNIALANILLNSKEDHHFVIENIQYLDLFQNMDFTQKLFQKNLILEKIKQCFAKQILQQDPTDREFIINLFDSLNFNETTQKEIIKELLREMSSPSEQIEISEQMQVAIAHTIIEKYSRGPSFLLANITSFEKTYIANNINKFNLSEEQKKSLLEKCTASILV